MNAGVAVLDQRETVGVGLQSTYLAQKSSWSRELTAPARRMEHQISPGKTGQGSNGGSNACIPCRKVKMKCQLVEGGARCGRCERKSLSCVYQQHRRGRKVGMRTSIIAAIGRADPSVDGEDSHLPRAGRRNTATSSTESALPPVPDNFWPDGHRDLPPANVLSNQVQDGGFSLQNVLSPGHQSDIRTMTAQSCPDSRDPVVARLLNQAIASSLFAGFMSDLNPFVSQLDPELHTLNYVQATSPFLFTAALMAASKVFNPALYSGLRDHAEVLLLDVIRYGWKSAEVVQAILIMTYYKDPEDTRVFVNVGLAIRIALDLGWHELASATRNRETETITDERGRRNAERTWLVLFVYDRSLAIQTGRPTMIEHDALIDPVDDWQRSSISLPSDALLCALVKLRLLTLGMPGTIHRHGRAIQNTPSMTRLMHKSVEQWLSRWVRVAKADQRHQFLVEFYGRHTLLLLRSEELHQALNSKLSVQDPHLQPIWHGFNATLDVLRLVIEKANDFVYFVQDSVHVMIAHAAVLLVKTLLSVRSEVRDELESSCLSTLRSLLAVLSAQAAPTNSACSLQAALIANLLGMLEVAVPSDHIQSTRQGEPTAATPDPDGARMPHFIRNAGGDEMVYPSQGHTSAGMAVSDSLDSSLVDDETWATVFATAGFDIMAGTFLPDLAAHQSDQ
ncbi:uncharacterized protein RCC_07752 [Ramularia collo-cygni]|uniref:Zn(2)-C6 fungal-type domain-containing protein n=1 Tax=Ramularia collo-cygni TaxID=112498 RepID=A0A2D3VDK7_9PEZI|nr:uncharacterized protein RCC_07752 [Ramularia collo-cygni]CZT21886.1 uncharacterized protein RCC_07752 [Ramularia collo-cygni]